ncbi:MAG: VWA domain-containing protein [Verrucomicrobia bacterium]|nr:VWA domain-containing protein [Verrucomicrobiota bacterium]
METLALTFGAPLWLWGLLALPVFAGLYVWSHLRGRALVSKVVAPRLREQLAGSVSVARRVIRGIFIVLSLGLVLVALAQPRYGFTQQEIKQRGRDIIVAVDTSRSMLATDVAPNRLTRAKLMTQDLVRLLKGDRVGLIAFAGSAFLQAPLTLDYTAVVNSLEELDTSVIPKGGTNIASAIAIAEQAFGKAEGQTRALVILTDGEELDADGVAAAKKAAEHGIRIFTVGIGSSEGSLIPFRSEDGKQDFVRDVSGKPVQTRLDESRLSEIARETGGFYVPIGPDAAREIFQQGIEPMDRAETGLFSARQPLERYQWPLGFAVGFLILWLLLGERRRVRPRRALAAALIAFALVPRLQAATPGLQDYQSGNFENARKAFEKQLKSSPDSREVQFNAGASAYKLGDFEQAISHFTSALLSEDSKLREDAAYNLANSLVRRGEAAKEKDAKKADWKNAIEQYTEALNLDAKNKQAQENRDIVKKLLEDLEKQEKQQDQKKDQQKKDQKQDQKDKKDQKDKQDQQNKDQQNKDQKDQQDKQDQQNKDQQGKDQKDQQDKQDQQNKDQQGKDQKDQQDKQDQQGKDQKDQQDKQDQQGKDQKDQPQNSQGDPKKNEQKPGAAPTPTPGEKKEGDVKSAAGDEKKEEKPQEQAQAAAAGEEQGKDGEMSAAQARALLKSLNSEEEKVNLMQQPTSQEVLRDW